MTAGSSPTTTHWLCVLIGSTLGALTEAQTPPAAPSAAAGAGLCGSASTITWSPGGLDPATGHPDTAVDSLTVCSGEPISAGGALVGIDCAYMYNDDTFDRAGRETRTGTQRQAQRQTHARAHTQHTQHTHHTHVPATSWSATAAGICARGPPPLD